MLTIWSLNILAQNEDYIGLWQTVDDKTKQPRSVVEIYIEDDKLKGNIIKFFPQPGEDADPVCDKCKGELLNSKIIGMQIIDNMKLSKGKWKDGKILDPDDGKFYDCKIWLDEQTLKVRGYIGFFYRTQEWLRYQPELIED